jgi:hypothetical protein
MATDRIENPPRRSWSRFEVLDLRLGLEPIGHGELAGVEHLDLLLATPASRAAMRLTRGLRRRFPQRPISAPTASVGPTGVRADAIPGLRNAEAGI